MFSNIFLFLGGIAVFIFGVNYMSGVLKNITENKFNNLILSILIGSLITTLTNWSAAIIVLVIGLVRAELISSRQSVGLITIAKIGTTFFRA